MEDCAEVRYDDDKCTCEQSRCVEVLPVRVIVPIYRGRGDVTYPDQHDPMVQS